MLLIVIMLSVIKRNVVNYVSLSWRMFCWVSLIGIVLSCVSLYWMSLCCVSLFWMSLCWVSWCQLFWIYPLLFIPIVSVQFFPLNDQKVNGFLHSRCWHYKTFLPLLTMLWTNTLECLSCARLFSQASYLRANREPSGLDDASWSVSQWKVLALLANIRLGWKVLRRTNNLTYFSKALLTKKKVL
jgi:hypothetical protein